ncbi:DoxX-like protein [Arcticibacter tournemirensis]|uniref:DoxX family protein n=1 Tax=Arcticibacter tournemirensis TaxID=699437 RepID=A0A5M9H9H0_9SPHI|nr:DoxX family protein [Arcticibacter tournemirensis]KAA8482865.1 DoxX family protein [Arcticibacter tournemirensis]TQM49757.1 DoxX-like protein [Arcticibacter tournemirensis]
MKTNKITYWVVTILVSVMMINSAVMYLTKPEIKQAFVHLGFPSYFRVELAALKVIGAIVLLVPLPRSVKEWAYSGFAITFVSAFVAHSASGDPASARIMPIIFLVLLVVSYITYHRNLKFDNK